MLRIDRTEDGHVAALEAPAKENLLRGPPVLLRDAHQAGVVPMAEWPERPIGLDDDAARLQRGGFSSTAVTRRYFACRFLTLREALSS